MNRLWINIRRRLRLADRRLLSVMAGLAVFYALLGRMGITCPILFLTGISCAGCGMSRAWISLLQGNFPAAVFYHPLFWIPPLAVLIWLLQDCLPRRLVVFLMWAACVLFLAVYAFRMTDAENAIVVFHPENGLLARLAAGIWSLLREIK